jgi:hypothetical protein
VGRRREEHMTTLYVQNKEKWFRVIDAISAKEVTAKEKLLARHLPEILDWFGEQATEDSDLWGTRTRIAPQACVTHTGMSKSTIWRILTKWNECGLISKKTESYKEANGSYHSRMYIELSERFYNGDIRTGKEIKKGHVEKGYTWETCPNCGHRTKKKVCLWEKIEQEGQESIEFADRDYLLEEWETRQ